MRVNHGPVLKVVPAVLAAVVLLLAGCSSGSPDAAPAAGAARAWTAPRTMPAGMGSGAADGVFPRTVKHFSGSTTLPAAPKRVVVISTGQADALLTLGVVPVGTTRGDGAELVPRYLLAAYPQAAKVADVGSRTAPDLETIGNLKPDLVVMNTAGKNAAALYASLSAIAPAVATQGTGLYWKQDFLLLADALGKTQQAQHILDSYHADAAALGASLHPEPTVSFLRRNADRLRIFGVPSFTGSIAEDAGLARPSDQQFGQTSQDISNEELDRADGDWIFYGVQGGPAKAAALTSAPLWPTLGAVAAKTAIPVDDDVFYLNTGPTAAREVLEALQHALRR
ncbi:ABC transporter substrate-binding protein [Amycolatopsis sp. NBC_01480]|uniref:ABC transporter substrate-binding protein n=1 Tax=Amycolatopsis sp. NBC_01480 TaxID=2903562 RepID=UPI002E27B1B6|nr:ABC transporter substrate-binding protein [Amycolatopsis sp. NBC_01480]